jgi:hypothetical protein
MGIECDYSYNDLFRAAYNRLTTVKERELLSQMTQKDRNKYVRRLAGLAEWETKDKLGSDNQIYTAFAPKF